MTSFWARNSIPQGCISDPLVDTKLLEPLIDEPVVVAKGHSTGGDSFSVNLETCTGDVAIHINPRFHEGVTVVNVLNSGAWGAEERYPLLVGKGEHFVFQINASGYSYKVLINSQLLTTFKSVAHCKSVAAITVYGAARLRRVNQYTEDCEPTKQMYWLPGMSPD
ncbi:galectin-9-like isoform X2 [Ornithodoros turicata]|uniref:galectin-9-like isoform X2 n=1 Tax=Ornithodoros turicata TaxID=34597 RepID=UPI0031398CFD